MELLTTNEPAAASGAFSVLFAYSTTGRSTVTAELPIVGDAVWRGNDSACFDNCSGHGECHNGTCVCEIQYGGEHCRFANRSYFLAFASVFFALALVCLVQLVTCIAAEWHRMKVPSLGRACRVTTQKLLYFVVFLASLIRGAYFMSPTPMEDRWSSSLMSAYYPLLLSGSSLIVCFWAEVFHLRDVRWEKPQFLSKSFLAFVTFNVICYSLFLAEFYTVQLAEGNSPELKNFYTHVFNGCYAALLFIVLVFFLIYGVEVFIKVRGGFLLDEGVRRRAQFAPNHEETSQLFQTAQKGKLIDTSQLHQSRVGLLSQALMLSIVVVFLWSETLGEYWKSKVPLSSRNWHDLVFRVMEIGVALWFPCVLWNCMSPEQLWILNPKRIIKKMETAADDMSELRSLDRLNDDEESSTSSCLSQECYICRDTERADMGPLIQPCSCRGDISVVHHDCLKKWLVEQCCATGGALCCSVCNCEYDLDVYRRFDWMAGCSRRHCVQTLSIVSCMCVSATLAWVVVRTFLDPGIRTLAASSAMLIQYICVRFLSQKTEKAVRRSKTASLTIRGRSDSDRVSTISYSFSVSIASASNMTSLTTMTTASIESNVDLAEPVVL